MKMGPPNSDMQIEFVANKLEVRGALNDSINVRARFGNRRVLHLVLADLAH